MAEEDSKHSVKCFFFIGVSLMQVGNFEQQEQRCVCVCHKKQSSLKFQLAMHKYSLKG